MFGPTLKATISLGFRDDRYLQIAAAPLVCSLLIFLQRTEIFSRARYSPRIGIPLLSLAVLIGILAVYRDPGSESTGLLPGMIGMTLVWLAAFILCCGMDSFRAALYPLCCILLMIPLPASWMDQVAGALQHGSATLSCEILRLFGVPVWRHGMLLSLPHLDVEVAPECSGIHSSLALMIIAVVAGYVCLRSGLARVLLVLLTIPIALFKNAVRIVVISILGAYVDRAFVDGPFHHRYSGLLFSVVGVALFVALLAGLQKIENRLGTGGRSIVSPLAPEGIQTDAPSLR